jgi:hypothetical protein
MRFEIGTRSINAQAKRRNPDSGVFKEIPSSILLLAVLL